MDFQERYDKLHAHYEKATSGPCDNPKDQTTRDQLARYDRLHQKEEHALMCACQQVFGDKPCTCNTVPKEEHHAAI